jgi:hypothetical protein
MRKVLRQQPREGHRYSRRVRFCSGRENNFMISWCLFAHEACGLVSAAETRLRCQHHCRVSFAMEQMTYTTALPLDYARLAATAAKGVSQNGELYVN